MPNLPYKGEMDNLNNVRVSLKHHATFPNADEITRCREDVKLFLTTCMEQYFKVDFETLSLASLIAYDEVKKLIEEAEQYIKDGCVYESLLKCKLAFIMLLAIYESDKKQWFKSILDIGETIGTGYEDVTINNPNGAKWLKQITNTTNDIRTTLKIISLGIDYKKYVFFNFLTPHIRYTRSPIGDESYIPDSKTTFESEKYETFVPLYSGETLISTLTIDINNDGYDDEVIIVRKANSQNLWMVAAVLDSEYGL